MNHVKNKARIILLLAILLLAVVGLYAYSKLSAPEALVLFGTIDQRQIELAFIDSERIAQVLVEEGDIIQPEQVLARLETRRLEDRIQVLEAQTAAAQAALTRLKNGTRPEEIEQAKAMEAAARAEVAFARTDYQRFADIWQQSKGSAISRQNLDDARLRLNLALANLRSQEESLKLAQLGPRHEDIEEAEAQLNVQLRTLVESRNKLGDAELKSPAHSVVRSRLLEPGDMASPERPVFSLAILSPKWVRAYISEINLGRIKPGQEAQIFIDSAPDKPIAGRVGFISSVAEFTPKTVQTEDLRTALVYEIRIMVEDPEDMLRLGMPATIKFPGL